MKKDTKMINRRNFIRRSIQAGVGSCLTLPVIGANSGMIFSDDKVRLTGSVKGEGAGKPDIIFLMTDQQRWDAIGINNQHIKTPNLDRLASGGILYNQATCQAPMCTPSRNSMMLGLYPSQLGIRSNGSHAIGDACLPCDTIPSMLQKAGYQTAGFGKTHWGKTDHPIGTRGFETRVVGTREVGVEIGAVHYQDDENPSGLAAYRREVATYQGGEEGVDGFIGKISEVADRDHRDGWVAEKCLEFLDTGIDPTRPLFLYLSFLKPHAGLNVPGRFVELYDIKDIPDTEQPPWTEEPDTHLSYCDKANNNLAGRYIRWKEAWSKMTTMERRHTTLLYYANCSWLDNYFGQALEKLEKAGRLKNSLVVFTSDHGEMLGERNFRFTKYCLYESSVRVPILLSGSVVPEVLRGTIDNRHAELVDICPTIAKVAGTRQQLSSPGLDLLSNQQHKGSFCEFHDSGTPAYMWRTKQWKLILFSDKPLEQAKSSADPLKGELYHLETDPHEWKNLYSVKKHRKIREQLKTELLEHLAYSFAGYPVGNG